MVHTKHLYVIVSELLGKTNRNYNVVVLFSDVTAPERVSRFYFQLN